MPSVGLCLITKEVTGELVNKLVALQPHVDSIVVQVNGPNTKADDILQLKDLGVEAFRHTWQDNFAEARNALLDVVTGASTGKGPLADFWLWLDSDDELQGAENIRSVVEHMEQTGVDIMYARYLYHVTDRGIEEEQQRERIIRTSLPGKWKGAIHEVWFPDGDCVTEHTDLVTWVHTKQDFTETVQRNRRILLAEYPKNKDPRIAYYLGLNYQEGSSEYEEAIKWFMTLIRDGGWDEERGRAWIQIFGCYFELGQYDQALEAALRATTELPEWPDAYFMLQQLYYHLDDHQKALEWFQVGMSKPQPKTDSSRNPITVVYQPLWLAAYSYMCIGEPSEAMKWAVRADKLNPKLGKDWQGLKDEILKAVNEELAVNAAKTLLDFAERYNHDPVKILDALPAALRSDVRLTPERRKYIPGVKWPKGSVAYYCGQSYESWGPDTLDKGMGGSEEAVVYLSRELGNVTVFNERPTTYWDGKVTYLPWTEINPNDEFDVFIAWRSPEVLRDVKARLKLCDVHDIMPPKMLYAYEPYVDKYMFKSRYHRELYPELPDSKCVVIGNGIKREQFK